MKKSLFSIMLLVSLFGGYAQAETVAAAAASGEQNTANARKAIDKITQKSTNTLKASTKSTAVQKTNQSDLATVASKHNTAVVLQLGAFTDPNLAYKQAAKVSLLGVPAKVVRVKNRNGDTVRIVRSSTRLQQAEAEKAAADLREQQVNVILMSQ